MITRAPRSYGFELLWDDLVKAARACCANPNPQLMYDTDAKKVVLMCMNCGAFC